MLRSARFLTLIVKSKGFTLIELLIVVSLIAVMTGALIPGFSKYIDNQNVRQGLEQVKDDLRTVQNRALTGEDALTVLPNSTTPLYWGINFNPNVNKYDFFITEVTSACPPTNRINKGSSSVLPGGNVIRSDFCVFFSFENGDALFSGASSPANLIVGQQGASTGCKRLRLYTNGLIEKVDTDLSCI